jgi:PA14 domain
MLHVFKPFNAFRRYTATIALAAAFIGCTQTPTTDPNTARVNNVITSGLTGEYFDNIDFTGTKQTRVDTIIDSSWGTTAPIAGIASDSYSVRWTGQIQPAFTEEYTFSLTSSGQARLMINGVVLVNNWTEHASTVDTGKVSLQANTKYDIRLEYARNAVQPAQVKLEWQSTSQTKQVVPNATLFSSGSNAAILLQKVQDHPNVKALNLTFDSLAAIGSLKGQDAILVAKEANEKSFIFAVLLEGTPKFMFRQRIVGSSLSVTNLINQKTVDLGDYTQYFSTDGSQTAAQRTLLLNKVYSIFTLTTLELSPKGFTQSSSTGIRTQDHVPPSPEELACFRIPPVICDVDGCSQKAYEYSNAECELLGAKRQSNAGAAGVFLGAASVLIGVATIASGPIGWGIAAVVVGTGGVIAGTSAQSGAGISIIPLVRERERTYNAFLPCLTKTCPVIAVYPDPLQLVAQVNTSTTGELTIENKGNTSLRVTNTTLSIQQLALSGAKLEIQNGFSPSSIADISPGAKAPLGIKGTCGSTVGVLSGTVTISSNDPSSPEKQVGVRLICYGSIASAWIRNHYCDRIRPDFIVTYWRTGYRNVSSEGTIAKHGGSACPVGLESAKSDMELNMNRGRSKPGIFIWKPGRNGLLTEAFDLTAVPGY